MITTLTLLALLALTLAIRASEQASATRRQLAALQAAADDQLTTAQDWYRRGYDEATQIITARHQREAETAYQKGRRDGVQLALDEIAAHATETAALTRAA